MKARLPISGQSTRFPGDFELASLFIRHQNEGGEVNAVWFLKLRETELIGDVTACELQHDPSHSLDVNVPQEVTRLIQTLVVVNRAASAGVWARIRLIFCRETRLG